MTNNNECSALVSQAGLGWQEEATRQTLAEALGDAILARLQARLERSDTASLVVSGGSTPGPLFDYLSKADIDWARVSVTLADERWVAPGHADSNESLVRNTLLVGRAAVASFVPMYRAEPLTPDSAVEPVSADVLAMAQPFTAVILGMGGDGHTASLFPDAPATELAAAMDLNTAASIAIMHPPSVSQVRITLTRAALLNAEHRFLHFTGDDKLAVLRAGLKALNGGSYSPGMFPIVGLLDRQSAAASVYWSS